MARRGSLSGGSLNPFGSQTSDFGAFNILDPGQEAYLAFLKVQVAYNAGKATDTEYLSALDKYAKAQTPGTSDAISIAARLEETKFRVQRNVLVAKIQNGQASTTDLVAFDKASLNGLDQNSDEFRSRLDTYRQSQSAWVSEQEKTQTDLYSKGKMTTTQLQSWYKGLLNNGMVENNPDLEKSINDRINQLSDRVVDERDAKMIQDYNDGHVATNAFLAYAASARARYAAGTTQAQEWDNRIQNARESGGETSLLYRYNLSQHYAELERFVKSNSGKPGGGTSTSTSKRTVLGADGQWHTITSTSTHATKPSAASVAAYQKLQIQIQDAKRQMAEIAGKVSGVGGFVGTASVQKFYQGQLSKLAKGSAEWYRIQGKLDDLNDRLHQESVFSKQGIKITYPSGGGGGGSSSSHAPSSPSSGGGGASATTSAWNPAGSKGGRGGGGISLDQFMRAIASQESGGRYDARNAGTGAYGKYQILPQNWASWARKAGLSANAPMTPENQERVARAAFERLAKSYHGDWARVAGAWFGGVAGERNRGPRTQRYINAIMSKLGTTEHAVGGGSYAPSSGGSYTAVGGGGSTGAAYPAASGGGSARSTAAGAPPPHSSGGPLAVVVGTSQQRRSGETDVQTRPTGFPANLDSRQFEKFYANYERAFESGQESFVDTTSGHPIHYYIGDDPDQRRDRMRQLDDLRIKLYDERAVAYQGTATELTAANQRNEAYKDVARHEYMILDTESGHPKTFKAGGVPAQPNPIATGIRLLDNKTASIKANLDAAQAAFKRGDITAAYHELQMAQQMATDVNTANIAGYRSSAEAAIAAIQQATGGLDPTEALGATKGGQFQDDLNRLRHADDEIHALFDDKTTTQLLSDIKGAVKTDSAGDVMPSPDGKLILKDDTYWHITTGGGLELKSEPPRYDPATGQTKSQPEKTVGVKVKSGNDVIDARADYKVDVVGVFVDDAGQRFPIMGKTVNYKNADGTWSTFYENPLAPGQNGWSNKPYTFAAPTGFKPVDQGQGKYAYTFTSGSKQGWTLTLQQGDDGVYQVYGSSPGSIYGQGAVDNQYLGKGGDADMASLFSDSGIVRQGDKGDDAFSSSDQPVFGFGDAKDYTDWLGHYQPPNVRTIDPKTGQPPAGVGGRAIAPPFRDLSANEKDYILRGTGHRTEPTDLQIPPGGAPGAYRPPKDTALPPLLDLGVKAGNAFADALAKTARIVSDQQHQGGAPGAYRPPPPPPAVANRQGGAPGAYHPPAETPKSTPKPSTRKSTARRPPLPPIRKPPVSHIRQGSTRIQS